MLSQILVTGMKPRIKLLGLIATLGTAALSSGAGAQYAPAEVHIEAAPAETAPSAALVGPAPHPIAASQASSGQRRSGHRTAPVTATGDGEAYVQQLVAGRSQRKSALRKPVEGKRAAASMAHRPSGSRQSRSDSGTEAQTRRQRVTRQSQIDVRWLCGLHQPCSWKGQTAGLGDARGWPFTRRDCSGSCGAESGR